MVKKLLNCKLTPKPDDAADALLKIFSGNAAGRNSTMHGGELQCYRHGLNAKTAKEDATKERRGNMSKMFR